MAVCALIGAGPFNGYCFRARYGAGAYACVVAVDGGYASAASVGCVPDIAMGDFDSLGYVPQGLPESIEVIEYPVCKDESDMELALRLAQDRGFDEVEVYGAIGGRLDHTLANLQLFALFSERGLRVSAIDLVEADHMCRRGRGFRHEGVSETPSPSARSYSGDGEATAADDSVETSCAASAPIGTALTFLTGPAELRLEPHPGEIVSVFSLTDESHGVTETGLAYSLDDVVLTNRTSWGLSNEFTDAPATISVVSGTLVVFHPLF